MFHAFVAPTPDTVEPTLTLDLSLYPAPSHVVLTKRFDSDTQANPVCGRQISASYGGRSVTVQVVDRCTGCAFTDLDFVSHSVLGSSIYQPLTSSISNYSPRLRSLPSLI